MYQTTHKNSRCLCFRHETLSRSKLYNIFILIVLHFPTHIFLIISTAPSSPSHTLPAAPHSIHSPTLRLPRLMIKPRSPFAKEMESTIMTMPIGSLLTITAIKDCSEKDFCKKFKSSTITLHWHIKRLQINRDITLLRYTSILQHSPHK